MQPLIGNCNVDWDKGIRTIRWDAAAALYPITTRRLGYSGANHAPTGSASALSQGTVSMKSSASRHESVQEKDEAADVD